MQEIYNAQSLEGFALLFIISLVSMSDVMTHKIWSKMDGAVLNGMTTSYGTLLQAFFIVFAYALFIGARSLMD